LDIGLTTTNGALVAYAMALVLAPMLLGVINRTKALAARRTGPPLLQPYYDLRKLLGKGATYSETTTWIFRVAPSLGLAGILVALLFVPMGTTSIISFEGDLLVVVALLALARWAVVLSAMDTGSSFEALGASREVMISAVAEPALLLALGALIVSTGHTSLSELFLSTGDGPWFMTGLVLLLAATTFALLMLAENSRIPVDDPTTHLELTMVHEVMVLDNSGPDFAYITYARALKLWLFAALIVGVAVPMRSTYVAVDVSVFVAAVVAVAVIVGVVESTMARLQMQRVPTFLLGASGTGLASLILAALA